MFRVFFPTLDLRQCYVFNAGNPKIKRPGEDRTVLLCLYFCSVQTEVLWHLPCFIARWNLKHNGLCLFTRYLRQTPGSEMAVISAMSCYEHEHIFFWKCGAVFGKLTYFDFSTSRLPSGRKTIRMILRRKMKIILCFSILWAETRRCEQILGKSSYQRGSKRLAS